MPRSGKIRQFLDGLQVADLRAIHREFAPGVMAYEKDSDQDAFILRLRRSLKGAIERGDTTFSDLVEFAVRDAETRDRRHNTTIIENTLANLVFSRSLLYDSSKSVREQWICGEAFQALRMAFGEHSHTTVRVEHYFKRSRVDICVTYENPQTGTTYHYPIEVKRASETGNIKKLPRQLDKYRARIKPKPGKIYVFVVADVDKSLKRKVVRDTLNGARRRHDTKVIVKKNSDVRRALSNQ